MRFFDENNSYARKFIDNPDDNDIISLSSEAKTLERLKNPHVVKFIDIYRHLQTVSLIISPWCDFSLKNILEKKKVLPSPPTKLQRIRNEYIMHPKLLQVLLLTIEI